MPYDVKIETNDGKTISKKIEDLEQLKELLEQYKNYQGVQASKTK